MLDKGDDSVKNTFFILLLLFSIFVLGDIITTTWLIHNDPGGISNEGNPFGAMLYVKYGIAGLFIGKMAFFVPFSAMIITTTSRYSNIKWFRQASEIVVLGLIAYSLVILLNNLTAIIVLSVFKGLPFLLQILPTMKFLIIVFALSLQGSILGLSGLKSRKRSLEIIAGTVLIVIPLLVYDPLYSFLAKDPLLFIAYNASMLTIMGIAFYITDEIIRKRG